MKATHTWEVSEGMITHKSNPMLQNHQTERIAANQGHIDSNKEHYSDE